MLSGCVFQLWQPADHFQGAQLLTGLPSLSNIATICLPMRMFGICFVVQHRIVGQFAVPHSAQPTEQLSLLGRK